MSGGQLQSLLQSEPKDSQTLRGYEKDRKGNKGKVF
jgi:hypothetical protein